MRIEIKSRSDIEKEAAVPFKAGTALISITDFGYSFAKLVNMPDYVLQIAFDDVDNDVFEDELHRTPNEAERLAVEKKYHMLSDGQADQIADFYNSFRESINTLICQCEHGQSRSAAVAAAVSEYEYHNGIEIFADDNYYPNKLVYRKVYNKLKSKDRKNDSDRNRICKDKDTSV